MSDSQTASVLASRLIPKRAEFRCCHARLDGFDLGYAFCHSASRRCISSLETLKVLRTALSKR
jgi:hypothetical protein